MRAFVVGLPSGTRYWTVVDEDLRVHREVDAFVQHVRFGRGCAGSTTRAYATATALYLVWCAQVHRDWREAADRLGGFVLWLRHAPGPRAAGIGDGTGVVRAEVVVRQPARINAVLVAVREFLKHAVVSGDASSRVLSMLYEVGDDRWMPTELRGERTGLRYMARPRHRRLNHPGFDAHHIEEHFVKRKVSLGSCGRAYGTNCHHEHACLRCALLRPDPDQVDRLREIITNLHARITEAEQNNWLGEVEGLKVSLTGAQEKLDEMERLTAADAPVLLGLPTIKRH